ncbi:MAG: hypothetical protein ACYTGQ_09365 [Planctomycetota bacterium]|jgi:hypothetical protein
MGRIQSILPSVSWDDLTGDLGRFRWYHWLPLDAGPLGIVFVYACYAAGELYFCSRAFNEPLAIVLTTTASLCYLVRVCRSDNPVFKLLLALALAFLCREIHFTGTGKGVYIAIACIGAWAWWKQEQLMEPLRVGRLKPMLIMTAVTYLLSQLIARRVFIDYLPIPLADELQTNMEEVVENTSHLMLIATAFSDGFRRPGGDS